MFIALTILLYLGTSVGYIPQDSDSQKREFIALVATLPTKGEFFTDEAIDRAEPELPVFFSLTEADLKDRDLYPFFALSRGLCDRPVPREYGRVHFNEIEHEGLKLFWAAMLFNADHASPEVLGYLQQAVGSEALAAQLSEMCGPEYGRFLERLKSATAIP